MQAEHHRHDKALVAHEAKLQRAVDEAGRLDQKREQLLRERRQNEDERQALDRRQDEARASIARLDEEQLLSDERLTAAQQRLFEAREAAQHLSRRSADAGASHAALVERARALGLEVERLREAAEELELRESALGAELRETGVKVLELRSAVASAEGPIVCCATMGAPTS